MTIINNKIHKEQEKLSVDEYESKDANLNEKNKSIGNKRLVYSSNLNNNRCALCFKLLKNWKGIKISPYYEIDKLTEFKPGSRHISKIGRQKEDLCALNDGDILFNKKTELSLDENNNCLNGNTVLVNNNSCSSKSGEKNVEILRKQKNTVLSLKNGNNFDKKSIEDADLNLNSHNQIGDLIRKTLLSLDNKKGFYNGNKASSSSHNNLTFASNKICKTCYDHVILIDYHMSCVDNLRILMQSKINKSFKVSNKTRNIANFKYKLHRFKPKRKCGKNNSKLRNSFLNLINSENEFIFLNEKSSNPHIVNGVSNLINFKTLQLETSNKIQSLKRKTSVSEESINLLNNPKLSSFSRLKKNGKRESVLKIQPTNLNGYCSPTSSASLSPSSTVSASSLSSMSNGLERSVRQNSIETENITKNNQLLLTTLLTSALSTLSPLNQQTFNKNQIQSFKNINIKPEQVEKEQNSENEQSNQQLNITVSPSSSNRRKNKIPSRLSNQITCRPNVLASTNEPNNEDESFNSNNNNKNLNQSSKQSFKFAAKPNGINMTDTEVHMIKKLSNKNNLNKFNNSSAVENSTGNKQNHDYSKSENVHQDVQSNLQTFKNKNGANYSITNLPKHKLNNQNLNFSSVNTNDKKLNNSRINMKSSNVTKLYQGTDISRASTENTALKSNKSNIKIAEFSNKENDSNGRNHVNPKNLKINKNVTKNASSIKAYNENNNQVKKQQKFVNEHEQDDFENEGFDSENEDFSNSDQQRIKNRKMTNEYKEKEIDYEDDELSLVEEISCNRTQLDEDEDDDEIANKQLNGEGDEDEEESNRDYDRDDDENNEENGVFEVDEDCDENQNENYNEIDGESEYLGNQDEIEEYDENEENLDHEDEEHDDDGEIDPVEESSGFQSSINSNLSKAKQKNVNKNNAFNFNETNNIARNKTITNTENGSLKLNGNFLNGFRKNSNIISSKSGLALPNKNRNQSSNNGILINGKEIRTVKSESDIKQEYSLGSNGLNNSNGNFSSSNTKHSCNICKKTFKTQNILRQHMRIHTGDKPFSCEICNKAFSQMASLKYHLATHSDDRPFRCENCSKTFKLKPPYKKHVKECQPRQKQAQPSSSSSNTSSSFFYPNNNVNNNSSGLKIEMNDDDE